MVQPVGVFPIVIFPINHFPVHSSTRRGCTVSKWRTECECRPSSVTFPFPRGSCLRLRSYLEVNYRTRKRVMVLCRIGAVYRFPALFEFRSTLLLTATAKLPRLVGVVPVPQFTSCFSTPTRSHNGK